MSRQFDAKHEALAAHPEDREAGVSLFLGYLGVSKADFAYEEGKSAEEYIYGAPSPKQAGIDAMSKPDRQDGFYWVRDKLKGKWRVAEWREGSYWLVAGLPHTFHDDNVGAEIDERRIERQPA